MNIQMNNSYKCLFSLYFGKTYQYGENSSTSFPGISGIDDISFALETKHPKEKVIHFYLCPTSMSQISSECGKSLYVYMFLAFT